MEHKKMDSDSSHPSGDDSVARVGSEVPSLHAAIMNMPCKPREGTSDAYQIGYLAGHRDARHAAAELAATYEWPFNGLLLALARAHDSLLSLNHYVELGSVGYAMLTAARADAHAAIARATGAPQ